MLEIFEILSEEKLSTIYWQVCSTSGKESSDNINRKMFLHMVNITSHSYQNHPVWWEIHSKMARIPLPYCLKSDNIWPELHCHTPTWRWTHSYIVGLPLSLIQKSTPIWQKIYYNIAWYPLCIWSEIHSLVVWYSPPLPTLIKNSPSSCSTPPPLTMQVRAWPFVCRGWNGEKTDQTWGRPGSSAPGDILGNTRGEGEHAGRRGNQTRRVGWAVCCQQWILGGGNNGCWGHLNICRTCHLWLSVTEMYCRVTTVTSGRINRPKSSYQCSHDVVR